MEQIAPILYRDTKKLGNVVSQLIGGLVAQLLLEIANQSLQQLVGGNPAVGTVNSQI